MRKLRKSTKSPLFRKMPELETGLSKMAEKRSSEKNMRKIMQGVDAIRIAKMIGREEGEK